MHYFIIMITFTVIIIFPLVTRSGQVKDGVEQSG